MNISKLKVMFKLVAMIALLLGAALCVAAWFVDPVIAYAGGFILLVLLGWSVYCFHKLQYTATYITAKVISRLSPGERTFLQSLPLAIVVCDKQGEICWYNDMFDRVVLHNTEHHGDLFSVISTTPIEEFLKHETTEIQYQGNYFNVSATADDEHIIFYFTDITTYKKQSLTYLATRPCVMIIQVDNYSEIIQNIKESEKALILSKIDEILEDFSVTHSMFLSRLSRDKFIAIVEQQHLKQVLETRFSVLDLARSVVTSDKMALTLSIGVGGCEGTLAQSAAQANQALDMCLGRGGDQAAMKTENGFVFYGGVSRGMERRTKVKTRIIATAITELVQNSDKVVVMGHRFGDLDSLGSSIGLALAIRALGKHAVIAVDKDKNLAGSLMQKTAQTTVSDLFFMPSEIIDYVTKRTLLVVLDTHSPDCLESKALYEACSQVVVIDHHRKVVNHIENAVIFYHEPYASSACEMVTELVQYFGDHCKMNKEQAEALLAGIMLDTKNFTVRTGARTFEAAAHLRRMGADTVQVRKLFSSSIESYQRKAKLVSNAEIYRNCAIVASDFQSEDLRIVAPQAADELLGINDVSASFVLYEIGGGVSISARSMGELNVQMMMETLGGGGHHTMAGAQLADTDIADAKKQLYAAIDEYYHSHDL